MDQTGESRLLARCFSGQIVVNTKSPQTVGTGDWHNTLNGQCGGDFHVVQNSLESRYSNSTDVWCDHWCKFPPAVDEAHCCDTSRSFRILIRWHSKATSSEQGCKPSLVKWLLYRSDVLIQHPTELASLACTLQYSLDAYWVLNTHTRKMQIGWQSTMHTEGRRTRHRFTTLPQKALGAYTAWRHDWVVSTGGGGALHDTFENVGRNPILSPSEDCAFLETLPGTCS